MWIVDREMRPRYVTSVYNGQREASKITDKGGLDHNLTKMKYQ